MDATEFRRRAKEMVDYVADYLENVGERRTVSAVQPGYMKDLIPSEAPVEPEAWEDVFKDIERVIMPGVRVFDCNSMFICIGSKHIYQGLLPVSAPVFSEQLTK